MQLYLLQTVVPLLLIVHIKNLHASTKRLYLNKFEGDAHIISFAFGLENVRELALTYGNADELRQDKGRNYLLT